jgi:EpsI family protein
MVQSKKLLTLILLLSGFLVPRFLLTGVRVVSTDLPVGSLPDACAEWNAAEVLVCRRCLQELKEAVWERKDIKNPEISMFYMDEEAEDGTCPTHGTSCVRTTDMPPDFLVQKVLPPGTKILRKWYRKESPQDALAGGINATVVISGSDKRSIHRPERCLQAQGWQIVSRDRFALPSATSDGEGLGITRLVVRRVWLQEKRRTEAKRVVFYWFMGDNRITGSNLKRLAYTAWDRMIRRRNYRWSYILLISPVSASVEEANGELSRFAARLLPLVRKRKQGPQ